MIVIKFKVSRCDQMCTCKVEDDAYDHCGNK